MVSYIVCLHINQKTALACTSVPTCRIGSYPVVLDKVTVFRHSNLFTVRRAQCDSIRSAEYKFHTYHTYGSYVGQGSYVSPVNLQFLLCSSNALKCLSDTRPGFSLDFRVFNSWYSCVSLSDYKQLPGWDPRRGCGLCEWHALQGQQEKGRLCFSLPLPKTPCPAPAWGQFTRANEQGRLHDCCFKWRNQEGSPQAAARQWPAHPTGAAGGSDDRAGPTGRPGGREATAEGGVWTQPGGSRARDWERRWGKSGKAVPPAQHWVPGGANGCLVAGDDYAGDVSMGRPWWWASRQAVALQQSLACLYSCPGLHFMCRTSMMYFMVSLRSLSWRYPVTIRVVDTIRVVQGWMSLDQMLPLQLWIHIFRSKLYELLYTCLKYRVRPRRRWRGLLSYSCVKNTWLFNVQLSRNFDLTPVENIFLYLNVLMACGKHIFLEKRRSVYISILLQWRKAILSNFLEYKVLPGHFIFHFQSES